MITRIEFAEVSDAALIHEIMVSAFMEYKNTALPSSALEESISSISAALKNGEQALISFDGCDEPAGMVRFHIREKVIYFYRLSVVPEKQGRGIAKQILQTLEDYAKRNDKCEMICRVRKNVSRNLNLYYSIGYNIYDEETVHKPNGIQIKVVRMKKKLE